VVGYFNEHKIEASAAILQARFIHSEASKAWSAAWDTFHGSFGDNEQKVVDVFRYAFVEWCEYCDVGDRSVLMNVLTLLIHPKLPK